MIFASFYINSNEPNIGFWGEFFELVTYKTKHTHYIFSFEGEKKKFQLGEFIHKVINMRTFFNLFIVNYV